MVANAFDKARERHKFAIWAYVFMPEHVHVIVWPKGEYLIETIRQSIKQPIARKALRMFEHNNSGWLSKLTLHSRPNAKPVRRFWQKGPGYDRNIVEPLTLVKMVDYIHANPVRRGLCERPMDWRWSSAGQFLDEGSSALLVDRIPPEWLS